MSTQARHQAFALTCLLVVGLLALLVLTRPDQPQRPAPGPVDRPAAGRPEIAAAPGGAPDAARAKRPAAPSGPRPARKRLPASAEVDRAARTFAGDWLDYLAGTRPVSAVRHIQPRLTLGFAGGDAPRVGPGRAGLEQVSCRARGARRHRCSATIDGLDALRFVMSTDLPGGRVQVTTFALD